MKPRAGLASVDVTTREELRTAVAMFPAATRLTRLIAMVVHARRALVAALAGIAMPLLVLAELAEGVRSAEGMAWEVAIMHAVHAYATPSRDALMILATRLGATWSLVLIALAASLVLLARHRIDGAFSLVLSIGGATVLSVVLKLFYHRVRPAFWVSPAPAEGYAFPSGHAMHSMAVAAAIVILAWRTRWRWPTVICGGLFVLVIGLSRVYLGVHYPMDILAGWSAGLAWVTVVRFLISAFCHRRGFVSRGIQITAKNRARH